MKLWSFASQWFFYLSEKLTAYFGGFCSLKAAKLTEVNMELNSLHQTSGDAGPQSHLVSTFDMDDASFSNFSLIIIGNRFQKAGKGFTGCAASVGCTQLQALMSPCKGGSENVCVNYDTARLAVIHHTRTETRSRFNVFLSFEVYILTARIEDTETWVAGFCSVDVRMRVYVGGSTHWVGLRSAMTHPPSSEAWWNSTHTNTLDWIHHADWASQLNRIMQTWLVLTQSLYHLICSQMLEYLTFHRCQYCYCWSHLVALEANHSRV